MALEVGGPGTQNPVPGAQNPGPGVSPQPRPAAPPRRERLPDRQPGLLGAGASTPRRHRMVVRKLDLWSVLKISLCFYVAGLAVTMVAGVVLWVISSSLGVVSNVEEFMGDLLSAKDFKFLSAQILEGATLVGLVLVILLVIITLVAAAFYNLFAELIGGIEITVEDE
jgi:Transmembrane domain of unknown function (DUF3566)